MPPETVDLLDTLKGESHYSSAILGTYQFGGQFFEEKILPTLRALDVANIIVLTDTQAYEASTDLRRAGEGYYFEHVQCSGIHHPKVCVLLGHERGLAIIGSANLTESGWRRNAELVTLIRYEEGESTEEQEYVFCELKEFFGELIEREMVASQKTREAIEAALNDAPWIPKHRASEDELSLRLLHNLNDPILPRALEGVSENTLSMAEIYSPFFSGEDISPFETLVEAGAEELVINLQPDSVEGFLSETINQDPLTGTNISVRAASMAADERRYIHAKLLLLTTSESTRALYGSANFTTPALLGTAEDGNVELSVLRVESDTSYFDDLIGPETVETGEINASDVTHRRQTQPTVEHDIDFRLSEAYLGGDGELVVDFDEIGVDEGILHLRRGRSDDEIDHPVAGLREGTLLIQEEEVTRFCREATLLFLSAELDGDRIESSRRWVALPSLGSVPRPSERISIENSRGRYGLIEVLNRLEGWESLLHFLDSIEFESSETGRGGISVSSISQDDEEGGSGMEPRDVTELSDVLEGKVSSFHNTIQNTSLPVGTESWEEKFHDLVDIYIGGSKFTIWWASHDSDAINEPRFIRTSTRELVKFVRDMRLLANEKDVYEFEADHQLLEHVSIIAYFIDHLQRREGFHQGANKRVYQVFRETWAEALETLGEARSGPIPLEENITENVEEYEGLQKRIPRPKHIVKFSRQLLEES